jgi:hypothetical protein
VVDLDSAIKQHEFQITIADGKHQNHRTAQRIASAVNWRPLKQLPRPILTPARSFPTQSYGNSASSEVCNRTKTTERDAMALSLRFVSAGPQAICRAGSTPRYLGAGAELPNFCASARRAASERVQSSSSRSGGMVTSSP